MYNNTNSIMQTLDIVSLIEKNPVTKLSKSYNNKLLNKIKESFTEQQQQLFVSSFYCYLNYNEITDFIINLDDVWKWLGYNQKADAKRAMEKYFIIDTDYNNLLINNNEQKKGHGGHNKETILMTIYTFKLFCIKSNTKKSNEIHHYFIKLEQLLQQTIHEQTNELQEQLEQKDAIIQQNKEQYNHRLVKDKEIQKQELLLRDFGSGRNLIYIVRVKTFEDGSYIVKIGESRKGVESRFKEHKKQYKENTTENETPENTIQEIFIEQKKEYGEDVVLLDVFPVLKCHEFEKYIHHHPKIKPSLYKQLQGHERETELFLVGRELPYATIIQVINAGIKQYNEYNEIDFKLLQEIIEKQNLKIELLELKLLQKEGGSISIINDNYQQLLQKIDIISSQITENTQQFLPQPKTPPPPVNTHINLKTGFGNLNRTIGPRLQKINPESLLLIRIYEYVEEAILESNNHLKRPSIDKAVVEGSVYHGFRWNYVPRENDPNIIYNLIPTKQTKIQNTGYIAKLNAEKTEIINVYLDRKTAATENGYESFSALDNPVKNKTISRNNYYMLFRECEKQLQNNFIDKYCNGDIENLLLYKDGVGQYDENGVLIREFVCKYDCITIQKMSDKTLFKCLDKNILYNGFYYRKIGSKIKVI